MTSAKRTTVVILLEYRLSKCGDYRYEMVPDLPTLTVVGGAESIKEAEDMMGLIQGAQRYLKYWLPDRQYDPLVYPDLYSDGKTDRVFDLRCVEVVEELPVAIHEV